MEEIKEIVVPQGFPINGIRAFAAMLPDDMGSVRDAILLMCDGATFNVMRIVSSANEQISKAKDAVGGGYVKAPLNVNGVAVKPSDYILDEDEWHEVIAVSENVVIYDSGDGFVCIDPSNSETRI